MNRDQGYKLVTDWTKNNNLVKHMLAVEAEMRGLARHFDEDENLWGLTGLIHDADYEQMQEKHPSEKLFEQLEKLGADKRIIQAVKSHAFKWPDGAPEPEGKMEWSLYCCDELSGLIIACALVQPDKKLSSVNVESVLKKWNKKDFAKGVHREQIAMCEEKLEIKLDQFIELNLRAMQKISDNLGL